MNMRCRVYSLYSSRTSCLCLPMVSLPRTVSARNVPAFTFCCPSSKYFVCVCRRPDAPSRTAMDLADVASVSSARRAGCPDVVKRSSPTYMNFRWWYLETHCLFLSGRSSHLSSTGGIGGSLVELAGSADWCVLSFNSLLISACCH